MREDTTTENEAGSDQHGDVAATDSVSNERRPSLVTLQHMLKKVSQSPFQNQYTTLVSSNSESSGSSDSKQDGQSFRDLVAAADETDKHKLHFGQSGLEAEGTNISPGAAQNGVNRGFARNNALYSYYLESGSKGHLKEDAGSKTSQEPNLEDIFFPPPEFQSSALDLQAEIKVVENGAHFSEPQDAVTPNHVKGLFQKSTSAQDTTTNGGFHDATLSATETPNLSKPLLFRAGDNREENFSEKSPSAYANPFKSPSNSKNNLSESTQPMVANPFYTAANKEVDLFQGVPNKSGELANEEQDFKRSSNEIVDIFSASSTSTVDPFPSPIPSNLFQDTSSLEDPFGMTPSKQYDPFQDVSIGSPDIFQPLPSKTSCKDGWSETKTDISSPDLVKATPFDSNLDTRALSSDRPQDDLPTPKHNIVQPSPFSRARNLSMTPSQSQAQMNHVQTFKRPPKPLPRTKLQNTKKPPMPEKPPKPERPPLPANTIKPDPPVPKTSPKLSFKGIPKPVIRQRPKTPENKPTDPENNVIYEDVLLIGQEKCVEDWPEDSPELAPDFKPSGTLRLRRESVKMKENSDGGSGEDQDSPGSQGKKKERKLRMSLLSRRGSKGKFPDDGKEGKSRTLPTSRKSSKDYYSEWNLAGEDEDGEQNGMDYRKKPLKTKVNQLLRRASTNSSMPDGSHMDGHLLQESKEVDKKSLSKKNSTIRRWSEGTVLDGSTGEDEENGGEAHHGEKKTKKMKIKFVPQRGYSITVEKTDQRKGAHGYTPRKSSKDKSQHEDLGAYGYTPRKKSQDDAFESVEELKRQSRLQSTSKADIMDDEELQRALHMSAGLTGDGDPYGMEDVKPKKPTKMKMLLVGRRSSKEDMLDDPFLQKKKSSFSAEKLDDDDLEGMDKRDDFEDFNQKGKEFMSPEMYASDQDEQDTCKPKKSSKLKHLKKHFKAKSKAMDLECEEPPGDYLSEAAKAEWLAAQMDEQAGAGLEDYDGEGDTDSLMEWWNTVEKWDEVPSDDEDQVLKEDEEKSFSVLADKVQRGICVYNKVFTERAEVLWQSVIKLHAIADNISTFHHKAKIAGITGGTTTAVGGVAAIAGLALAPVTFGASLIVTAVGVGVATAGGITSASAAISDNVNNMHDRKKVETVLEENEAHLLDIGKILHFVNQGLYKLRGHPFLRSGTQHYSKDWETRWAVQMISFADSPIMRATEITDALVAAVQGLFGGMDKYFIKDTRELKKGCKKEVVSQIKEVATVLNDGVVELNAIREELQEATGNV